MNTEAILQKLNIAKVNPGACTGPGGWLEDPSGERLVSTNPATGEPIAAVIQPTPAIYEQVVDCAAEAFRSWRDVPAPRRGAVIRDLGDRLRELKEPLGDLVSLEMGKIRAEGHGDLYVRAKVVLPTDLSDDAEKAAKRFLDLVDQPDPR